MGHAIPRQDPGNAAWSPLPDLSDWSVGDIVDEADGALARAARRVIRELDDPDGVISAFQSFVS